MRILITNDDSIESSQLLPLIQYCSKFGEVTTVVPLVEQSAKSHGIELRKPFLVEKRYLTPDIFVYAVDSTPADCVRFAILGMHWEFDLVISGINRGLNMGTDILYSGTVAAAREAMLQNIPALAFSTTPEGYETAISHLDPIFDYIFKNHLLEKHLGYNINIPNTPQDIRITRQGGSYFSDSFFLMDENIWKSKGHCVYQPSADMTLDTNCVMSGFTSIMPLTIDMTDFGVWQNLIK